MTRKFIGISAFALYLLGVIYGCTRVYYNYQKLPPSPNDPYAPLWLIFGVILLMAVILASPLVIWISKR